MTDFIWEKINFQILNRKTKVDKKISDVDKKISDVDKKISDVDKKISDMDKKTSDVDKKSSDVLALDLYTSFIASASTSEGQKFVRQTWTNFCQTSNIFPYKTSPKNKN